MARPLKATTALVRAQAREVSATDAADAEEVALAARFFEVRRQGLRTLVELAVECGLILLEGRAKLRRRFRAWVLDRLHLERSTAANYMAMAKLARSAPAVLERHKDLGVTKLYQVARLEPGDRDMVLATPDVGAMNDREFQRVVAPHRKKTRKVTGTMRAQGMREKVRSVTTRLASWRPGRIADDNKRKELREDLYALRRAIEDMLKRLA